MTPTTAATSAAWTWCCVIRAARISTIHPVIRPPPWKMCVLIGPVGICGAQHWSVTDTNLILIWLWWPADRPISLTISSCRWACCWWHGTVCCAGRWSFLFRVVDCWRWMFELVQSFELQDRCRRLLRYRNCRCANHIYLGHRRYYEVARMKKKIRQKRDKLGLYGNVDWYLNEKEQNEETNTTWKKIGNQNCLDRKAWTWIAFFLKLIT